MAAPNFDRQQLANDYNLVSAASGGKGALNFNMPQVPATTTQANTTEVNVNDILGLTESSKYPSLQQVGDTGYYYRDNYMYEPYTVTQSAPSYSGFGPLYGNQGGGSNRAEGTIEIGNQAFRPVTDANVTGFTAFEPEDGVTQYTPSMAYIYANSPRYVPEPVAPVSVYQSSGSLLPAVNAPSESFGAARFLSDNTLNNLNFGIDSIYDSTGSNTESSSG